MGAAQQSTVHVVGAGLAGLAAAVKLVKSGAKIALYEGAGQAGGRCRSYYEPALDMEIDNGNHLVLSGNRETMAYADMLGSRDQLVGPPAAEFDFCDLNTGESWKLRPNGGRIPWWIFSRDRRVPGTKALDYFDLGKLLYARKNNTIANAMPCSGLLYDRLWNPLLLAALNTEPPQASAALAAAVVKESLALGGHACRPLIAEQGLSSAFIDPALELIQRSGSPVRTGARLRAIEFEDGRASALNFGGESVTLGAGDTLVLAVPSWVAASLLPNISVPVAQRSIINGHFRIDAPTSVPPMLGVIGGTIEWIFRFPQRLSITISGADRLLDTPREELAALFWAEIQKATGLSEPMPRWQVIKEKRATFAALPDEDKRRPSTQTDWSNLFLAGDFTATGLPATIEGSIRSGFRAAEFAASSKGKPVH